MEFNEKLQKIRKEHNITQESLADKLNVSRQAVSKWESGTAYPDTEKLIQISKLFNISLDELINDNVESNKNNKNKKINFIEIINHIIEFVQNSFTMFWSMKFKEKIKCLFEMAIIALGIVFIAFIFNSIIIEIIRRIFAFLPHNIYQIISSILESLLYIAWMAIGLIVLVRIFKTRYLDYYIIIKDTDIEKVELEEPIKELKEKKDYKVVIRDPKDSSLHIFKIFAKFILFIIKCLAIIFAIPIIIAFITLFSIFVYSLSLTFSGTFFLGITIGLLGTIIFTFLIIEFIYNLIFNQKHQFRRIFIIFILSLCLLGIGSGLSFISLNNFTIYENTNTETKDYYITMEDNLIFDDLQEIKKENIIIDNNLNDIKLEISTPKFVNINLYTYNHYDEHQKLYKLVNINSDYNIELYKSIVEDLKKQKINNYSYDYKIEKIHISSKNLTKLEENQKNLNK